MTICFFTTVKIQTSCLILFIKNNNFAQNFKTAEMSEFTNKQAVRNKRILDFCLKIIKGDRPADAVRQYRDIMDTIHYREVIWVVDALVKQDIPMPELKKGINKLLNLFYKALNEAETKNPEEKSFPGCLVQNYREIDRRLKEIKPLLREFNGNSDSDRLRKELKVKFEGLLPVNELYVIKENLLFPLLEKEWDDFRCVQVMWSFHDDIRRNLKAIVEELSGKPVDMKKMNRLAGDIFFNIYAIKFRDEKILFQRVMETISGKDLQSLLLQSMELEWPYYAPDKSILIEKQEDKNDDNDSRVVDLKTGSLLPDQIRWMMNHLPVDVTYVDENNKVVYYSTPKKRIFPRTLAVIGRDVRNCHPRESVDVVERIVEAFRNGEKDHADFWIRMKGEVVYIRYFAIRDEEGKFRGVLEVSQEVSGIQKLEGEKRLLDWE